MRLKDQKTARKLRAQGWTLPEIAEEVSAGKGLVSLWVRDVVISKKGLERLAKRKTAHNGGMGNVRAAQAAWSEQCKQAREGFREEGRRAASKGDTLHALACALYWAEGSKSRNMVEIVNSDVNILKVFLGFLRCYFGTKNEEVCMRISAYTNVSSESDIVEYWVKSLQLEGSRQRSHNFNPGKYQSRGNNPKKVGRMPYGTCSILVDKSTNIIQHIYGAIEVYGGASLDPEARRPLHKGNRLCDNTDQ